MKTQIMRQTQEKNRTNVIGNIKINGDVPFDRQVYSVIKKEKKLKHFMLSQSIHCFKNKQNQTHVNTKLILFRAM